jgi:hypothetical protein
MTAIQTKNFDDSRKSGQREFLVTQLTDIRFAKRPRKTEACGDPAPKRQRFSKHSIDAERLATGYIQ